MFPAVVYIEVLTNLNLEGSFQKQPIAAFSFCQLTPTNLTRYFILSLKRRTLRNNIFFSLYKATFPSCRVLLQKGDSRLHRVAAPGGVFAVHAGCVPSFDGAHHPRQQQPLHDTAALVFLLRGRGGRDAVRRRRRLRPAVSRRQGGDHQERRQFLHNARSRHKLYLGVTLLADI